MGLGCNSDSKMAQKVNDLLSYTFILISFGRRFIIALWCFCIVLVRIILSFCFFSLFHLSPTIPRVVCHSGVLWEWILAGPWRFYRSYLLVKTLLCASSFYLNFSEVWLLMIKLPLTLLLWCLKNCYENRCCFKMNWMPLARFQTFVSLKPLQKRNIC